MEQEPNLDVVGLWERIYGRDVGEELECHGGGVVGDAHPVAAQRGEVGKAEEGLELAVGTQLEGDEGRFGAACGDDVIEGGDDLGGEGGAGDGTYGIRGVVGEGELVRVG